MFKTFATALLSAAVFAASGTFDYKMNGDDWGKIEVDGKFPNALCDTGVEQSPIDLTNAKWSSTQKIELNDQYKDNSKTTKIEAHTVKTTVTEGAFTKFFEDESSALFNAA